MGHGRSEGRESGIGEGPTSIYCGRTGGGYRRTEWLWLSPLLRWSQSRGVAAATAPDRTGAFAATPVDTHGSGTVATAVIVGDTGTDADTITSDGEYRTGDFVAVHATGGAGPCRDRPSLAGTGLRWCVFRVSNRAMEWAGVRS